MQCPICQNENLGKINKSRYFCSNCFIEISYAKKSKPQVFTILEDGSTAPIILKTKGQNKMKKGILGAFT